MKCSQYLLFALLATLVPVVTAAVVTAAKGDDFLSAGCPTGCQGKDDKVLICHGTSAREGNGKAYVPICVSVNGYSGHRYNELHNSGQKRPDKCPDDIVVLDDVPRKLNADCEPASATTDLPTASPPTTSAPTSAPPTTASPTVIVEATLEFGFFAGTDLRAPTQEELDGLLDQTTQFFEERIVAAYPALVSLEIIFVSVTTDLSNTIYPVLIDFDTNAVIPDGKRYFKMVFDYCAHDHISLALELFTLENFLNCSQ